MKIFLNTPKITRNYLFLSFLFTFYGFLFNSNEFPLILQFTNWSDILFKGQIWRLLTSFFFLGSFDLFYPLTLQFLWQHMSQLEQLTMKSNDNLIIQQEEEAEDSSASSSSSLSTSLSSSSEFLFLLNFGMISILCCYTIFNISMKWIGHNLGTYLMYIWSREYEGIDVNFMDIITVKAEILPILFILQSWLLDGQFPIPDLIGAILGHLYLLLRKKGYLKVFLKWFDRFLLKMKKKKYFKRKNKRWNKIMS